MDNKELNLEELENILGGAPKEVIDDKAIENESLYRQEAIQKLKDAKEVLLDNDTKASSRTNR